MTALGLAAVAIGAVLGAWLRWAVGGWLHAIGAGLPLWTPGANLGGAVGVGGAIAFFARHAGGAPEWRLAIITGFLGALTTYSTFSAEAVTLLARGQFGWAAVHSFSHLAGSLAMTALGLVAFRALVR